jgi:peptidoglycan-N-acetylglucosamine deacetylase
MNASGDTRPLAHVSVDLDPIDTHLAGYGLSGERCDAIYRLAIPRLLEVFDRQQIRATFFVVARDAEAQQPLWRELVARGHEIGSHSMTHPIPFATLPAADLERELVESRTRLSAASGQEVIGFRAPGWDVDARTLRAIAAAGYRYDASILPTPALLAGALMRLVLSGGRARPDGIGRLLRMSVTRPRPHRRADANALWEFPVAVSRAVRLPFTHTLWYVAPAALCARIQRGLRRSGRPLSYMLHAADALAVDADAIDTRMRRHPGMGLSLADKLGLLEDRLAAIRSDFHVMTYAAHLAGAESGMTA